MNTEAPFSNAPPVAVDSPTDLHETSYDKVPYTMHSFPQLNPSSLAAIGKLFGLQPADPGHCRVLELGCGHGLTPIALAQIYPESEFVGIDLSSKQIEHGKQIVDGAGLKKVQLESMSITDPRLETFGSFDYILCHGVYSWVPAEVQQSILRICAAQLRPHGIALISYNTYPGWGGMQMVRDIALDMADRREDPIDQVRLSAQFIGLVASVASQNKDRPDAALLKRMAQKFARGPASYLLHEFMEEHNSPCYFRDFMERAKQEGLQFVGETSLSRAYPQVSLGNKAYGAVQRLARDRIDIQQLMDYLMNTQFRHTLLTGSNVEVKAKEVLETCKGLGFQAKIRLPKELSLAHGVEQEFVVGGHQIKIHHAYAKALLAELARASSPISWDDLWSQTCNRVTQESIRFPADFEGDDLEQQVLGAISRLVVRGRITPHMLAANMVRAANVLDEKPVATPLTRYQASHSQNVSNLGVATRPLPPALSAMLALCDGEHSINSIVEEVRGLIFDGKIPAPKPAKNQDPVTDPKQLTDFLNQSWRVLLTNGFLQATS